MQEPEKEEKLNQQPWEKNLEEINRITPFETELKEEGASNSNREAASRG
jgi:hypothetical protein